MGSDIKPGAVAESSVAVDSSNTALAMGSGDMAVFATPSMVALAENAAMRAVAAHLPEGDSTVGASVSMSHVKPTATGDTVVARATLTGVEGRRLTFRIEAWDSDGVIGEGSHVRYIVSRERFLSKLK